MYAFTLCTERTPRLHIQAEQQKQQQEQAAKQAAAKAAQKAQADAAAKQAAAKAAQKSQKDDKPAAQQQSQKDDKPALQKLFGFSGGPSEPPKDTSKTSKAAEKSNITSIRTPQVSLFVRPHAVR